ncbi:MAG: Gp37 family protein [Moraxella sp.]|nr:Gp37 family protein [Moraxella sp.]
MNALQKSPSFSLTKDIASNIVEQLKQGVGNELAVSFYPEKPTSYRLNHTNGALLVSYGRSNYPKHNDTNAVIRPRELTYSVTVVSRGLYDRFGAVPLVDWVLELLSGFMPTHTTKPLAPIKDYFDTHESGLWFYTVEFATETSLVQILSANEF